MTRALGDAGQVRFQEPSGTAPVELRPCEVDTINHTVAFAADHFPCWRRYPPRMTLIGQQAHIRCFRPENGLLLSLHHGRCDAPLDNAVPQVYRTDADVPATLSAKAS